MLARFATKQRSQSQQEMLGFSGIHNSNKIICPVKELPHILLREKESLRFMICSHMYVRHSTFVLTGQSNGFHHEAN